MPTKRNHSATPSKKQPIPEDFELSDDEPVTVNLNEEQTLSSKFITFDSPRVNYSSERKLKSTRTLNMAKIVVYLPIENDGLPYILIYLSLPDGITGLKP